MNVIKRSGEEVIFDPRKILNAVSKANNDVTGKDAISAEAVWKITNNVVERCTKFNRAVNVEEIQDLVEQEIGNAGFHEAAKQYIIYRYKRALARQKNTTDEKILSLIDCCNEEVKQENSNKNPTVVSVQRDYMAGEVSKDLCHRMLLPKDIVEAHDRGILHFHK